MNLVSFLILAACVISLVPVFFDSQNFLDKVKLVRERISFKK